MKLSHRLLLIKREMDELKVAAKNNADIMLALGIVAFLGVIFGAVVLLRGPEFFFK